jgi:hypothetical protein
MVPPEPISAAKSLVEVAKELASLIQKALATGVIEHRVQLYLEVAQKAVHELGMERQGILHDARRCDLADPAQVERLWDRLDRYLHDDHIRKELQRALHGLHGCRPAIQAQAQALAWRWQDKVAAAETFSKTLQELEATLNGLSHNFYPGGSGMGVRTLGPIFHFIERVRNNHQRKARLDQDAAAEELGNLLREALRDKSNQEWIQTGGKVEQLIAELHLTFR